MIVLVSSFSARTTNPDGRNGRNPTVLRITRSLDTRTRAAMGTVGAGAEAIRVRRCAQAARLREEAARKSRRVVRGRIIGPISFHPSPKKSESANNWKGREWVSYNEV